MRLGVVLLASGAGRRFGGNKLLATLGGRPVIAYALDALSAVRAERRAVVTADEKIAALAAERGFEVVLNDAPEAGQAHTVALGAKAMRGMDAALFAVGDQPRLTARSARRLAAAFEKGGAKAACLRDETHAGNPAIFGSELFDELEALTGERGAKGILRAQGEALLVVDCLTAGELMDIDTAQALEEAEARLEKTQPK